VARGAINHDDYNGLVEKTSIDFLVFNVVFVLTSIQRESNAQNYIDAPLNRILEQPLEFSLVCKAPAFVVYELTNNLPPLGCRELTQFAEMIFRFLPPVSSTTRAYIAALITAIRPEATG
jgi:hypothetical protein